MTSEEVMRRLVKATLKKRGRVDRVFFPDGSVEEGYKNGGSACVYLDGEEWKVKRCAAGSLCSSYQAELRAMDLALQVVQEERPGATIICTDSQSLVEALLADQTTQDAGLENTKKRLTQLAAHTRMVIQWIPGHAGVEGNERADTEANVARQLQQDEVPISLEVAKRQIRREVKYNPPLQGRLLEVYGEAVARAPGTRRQQVLLAQLRAGHRPGSAYYRARIGVQERATCPDCGEVEDKDHWLVCGVLAAARVECGIRGIADLADEASMVQFLRRAGWL